MTKIDPQHRPVATQIRTATPSVQTQEHAPMAPVSSPSKSPYAALFAAARPQPGSGGEVLEKILLHAAERLVKGLVDVAIHHLDSELLKLRQDIIDLDPDRLLSGQASFSSPENARLIGPILKPWRNFEATIKAATSTEEIDAIAAQFKALCAQLPDGFLKETFGLRIAWSITTQRNKLAQRQGAPPLLTDEEQKTWDNLNLGLGLQNKADEGVAEFTKGMDKVRDAQQDVHHAACDLADLHIQQAKQKTAEAQGDLDQWKQEGRDLAASLQAEQSRNEKTERTVKKPGMDFSRTKKTTKKK